MKHLFVCRDVAYGVDDSDTLITNISQAGDLKRGSLGLFNEKGVLLTAANAATTIGNSKTFHIAVGRENSDGKNNAVQILTIPRRGIESFERVNFAAYSKPRYTIITNLNANDEGELYIKVQNTSFTNRNLTAQIARSYYKKSTESIADAINAFIAVLNKDNNLFTASLIALSTNFSITPKENGVSLSVILGDSTSLMSKGFVSQSAASVTGRGVGVDMRRMEEDFSILRGNGNYIDYTKEHYSTPFETDLNTNYDQLTFSWTGVHNGATGSYNAMFRYINIACVNGATAGATNQSVDAIQDILALIIPNAFSGTTNAITADEDGTDNDGVAGN